MLGSNLITLIVNNTAALEAGLSSSKAFDVSGGTIGSNASCAWVLRDKTQDIQGIHCKIIQIDNHFCIEDSTGQTYINGATMPIGFGRHAKLNQGDSLKIGAYQLGVYYTGTDQPDAQSSLEHVFEVDNSTLIAVEPILNSLETTDSQRQSPVDEPLSALDAHDIESTPIEMYDGFEIEPNTASLTDHQLEQHLLAQDQHWHGREIDLKADSEDELGSAIILKTTSRDREISMDEEILTDIENEAAQSLRSDFNHLASTQHIAAAPMMKGLGVPLTDKNDDMELMQNLSEEMGASLRAAIEGLLELHQQLENSRFNVLNKNLQPIEDNPLRLGLDYESTVQTLLTNEKNPVHLSAPAAIKESIAAVLYHNKAIHSATLQALHHILQAFSPVALQRRFQNYRRPHETNQGDADSWSWNMYQSYYKELTSNRQNGFEKLFWEVFDQAYDKAVREAAGAQGSEPWT